MRVLAGVVVTSALSAILAATGCTSTSADTSTVLYSSIYVDPSSLRGDLVCGTSEGAMRSLVLTLIDVTGAGADTDEKARYVLPSTPPTSCHQKPSYGAVVPAHEYVGEVDIYDRPSCRESPATGCIEPLAEGSRTMVDPQLLPAGSGDLSVAIIKPRWTTSCGDPTLRAYDAGVPVTPLDDAGVPSSDAPTVGVYLAAVPMMGCKAIEVKETTGGVIFSATSIAGGLGCGSAPAQVASLEIVRDADPDHEVKTLSCGESLTYEDLPIGKQQTFQVQAYESGATMPSWGARCHATPPPGVITEALCEELTDKGSARISATTVCNTATTFRASVVGQPTTQGPLPCGSTATFGALPAGEWTFSLAGFDAAGAQVATTLCRAQVKPGLVVDAACDPVF